MFGYTSPSGSQLTSTESDILKQVDAFPYSDLKPFNSLGDLHNEIIVELRDRCDDRVRKVIYEKTAVLSRIKALKRRRARDSQNSIVSSLLGKLEEILNEMERKKQDRLEKEERMTVLGEYIRKDSDGKGPKVVLYIETIRSITGNSNWLLAEVYVHEMHHAWFDHDLSLPANHVKEVEEPITEFGMLLFMEKFDSIENGILFDALRHVSSKKMGMASCYGFGAYLYDNLSERRRDWRNMLYQVKYNKPCGPICDYIEPFQNGLYPIDEKHWAEMLLRVLYESDSSHTGSMFCFCNDLVNTLFTFGLGVGVNQRNSIFPILGLTTPSIGDRCNVTVRIDGNDYDARLEIVNCNRHTNGVSRIVWLARDIVEIAFDGKFPDYRSPSTVAGMVATEVTLYHLGSNKFEII